MTVAASEIRNISAWRLNKTEMKELAERVEKGEDEAVVKKELQTKKTVACEERKKSAAAISAKPGSTGPKASKKTSSSPATQSATAAATPDPTNAGYYALVEADLQTILQEFPGIDQEMPLPLSKSELDGSKTGVQEPFDFDLSKAQHALGIHGVFRWFMTRWKWIVAAAMAHFTTCMAQIHGIIYWNFTFNGTFTFNVYVCVFGFYNEPMVLLH